MTDKGMPTEHAFDLYAKSASKKKSHKHQSGEGCNNPPAKKSRTDNPPASTPTKETTPQPAPARDVTPPPPGVLTMTSSWRCSRTLTAQFEKRLSNYLSAAEARYTEKLKASEATHAEQLKVVEAKHYEAIKESEAKHTEALKEPEAKHLEALQVTEAKLTSLEEELKKKEASIAKITESKEQYKETSLINYREAHKLQAELEISRKEVTALEEENTRNVEDYKWAAFECFYLF
ncbi:actin cytoskeleton-regulatory complex protein PAN1-like [Humulus lupulus]|uniref:actin cytoskeleton-regulatory complex protein PAN1-like n=1 Tax=Humulus lupulus TaxID=3486 RepID=UPI002B4173D9|nr:actin cytoskeleton-regulatory complex protein PAN1-like [Humulus lupulus]